MAMPMRQAKRRLAKIWFIGFAMLFSLFLALSIFSNRSPDEVQGLWSWFSPIVMPNLLLIVGVLVADAQRPDSAARETADESLLKLASRMSIGYLTVVTLTVLGGPFYSQGMSGLMAISKSWLGLLEGLNAALLGAFFVKTGDSQIPEAAPNAAASPSP